MSSTKASDGRDLRGRFLANNQAVKRSFSAAAENETIRRLVAREKWDDLELFVAACQACAACGADDESGDGGFQN